MNHKELAEDALEVAKATHNAGIEARFMARAQVHVSFAILELLEAQATPVRVVQSITAPSYPADLEGMRA